MGTLLARSMIKRKSFDEVVFQTLSIIGEDRLSEVTNIDAVMDLAEVPFNHHFGRENTSTPRSTQATGSANTATSGDRCPL